VQHPRFLNFPAIALLALLTGACATSSSGTPAASACPAGEERICRRSDAEATGSGLGSQRVCSCEPAG